MECISFRPDDSEIEEAVKAYSGTLFRLSLAMLGSREDAEDATSEAFLKYIALKKDFDSEEHKKAWLIRVTINICKNMLRFKRKRQYVTMDEIADLAKENEDTGVLADLLLIPEKYKTVLLLYYAEGYKTHEIAKMLNISESAARKRLQYGRDRLRLEYERDGVL